MRRKKVRIPNPPKSCIRLLQNKIDFGIVSKFTKTVIPVVVKPLTASKNASIKDFSRAIIKGIEPSKDTIIQPKEQRSIAVVRSIYILSLSVGKRIKIEIKNEINDV